MVQRYIQGPSKDPVLNYLIHGKEELESGKISIEVFGALFSAYREYFEKSCRNFRRLLKIGNESLSFRKSIEPLIPRYQEAKAAMNELEALASQNDFTAMGEPLLEIRAFSDAYAEFCAAFMKEAERANPREETPHPEKKCFRCGRMNPPEFWACKSCGFVFPQLEASSAHQRLDTKEGSVPRGFVMTENIEKLFNAIEDFQDGEIGESDLLSVIGWLDDKVTRGVEEQRAHRQSITKDSSIAEEMRSVLATLEGEYAEGLTAIKSGLNELSAWSESDSDDLLIIGINHVQDGAAQVRHAQKLAEKIVEELEPNIERRTDRYRGSA